MSNHKHYTWLAHAIWVWLRTIDKSPQESRYAGLYRRVIMMTTGEDIDVLTSKRWDTTFRRCESIMKSVPPIILPGMLEYDEILEFMHDSPHMNIAYKYLELDPNVLGRMLSPWVDKKIEYWINFPTVDPCIDLWESKNRRIAHAQFQKCPKNGRTIVFVEGLAWFEEVGERPRAHPGNPGWVSVLAQMFIPLRTLAAK